MPPRPQLSPPAELARRARPAILALRACVLVNAMLLVAGLLMFAAAASTSSGDGMDWLFMLQNGLATLAPLAIIVTAVFFLRWLYVARTNLDLVATHSLRNSRRWLMLNWFIPLGNAWFAYEGTHEVWRLSGVYSGVAPKEAGRGVGWWWLAWITYVAFLSYASDSEAFYSIPVSGALGVVSAWLAARVVARLTECQQRMLADQFPPRRPDRRA
jgi:hypothetical protein